MVSCYVYQGHMDAGKEKIHRLGEKRALVSFMLKLFFLQKHPSYRGHGPLPGSMLKHWASCVHPRQELTLKNIVPANGTCPKPGTFCLDAESSLLRLHFLLFSSLPPRPRTVEVSNLSDPIIQAQSQQPASNTCSRQTAS